MRENRTPGLMRRRLETERGPRPSVPPPTPPRQSSTLHVLGKPKTPQLEGEWSSTNVSKEALKIERRLARQRPELAQTFEEARREQASGLLKHRMAQGVAFLGLASAGVLGWNAYQESRGTFTMFHDPALRGTALPYLRGGIAAGRWVQASALGLGSAAELGMLGQGGLRVFGQAAGKWFLPVAIVVETISAGTAYYEHSTGRISQREFCRRTTGPAVFVVCTTAGGVIGGLIGGGTTVGPGAVPGAVAGAKIGAIVSVPLSFVANSAWNWRYREFNEQQRRAVDVAVEKLYGLRE